jgi:SAM-dependent methyltransferase
MLDDSEYPDGYFDCILSSALIEHFTDPLCALLRLNQIMRSGGHLMLLTPNLDVHSFARGPANFFKFVHTFYYTQDTLTSLLHKSGFEVEHLDNHYDPAFTWYSFIVVVARKATERNPVNAKAVRKPAPADSVNAGRVLAMLEQLQVEIMRFRRMFYAMYLKRALKFIALGPLRAAAGRNP